MLLRRLPLLDGWMDVMNSDSISIEDIAKRITEFRYDNEHKEIKEVVMEAAREHYASRGQLSCRGLIILKILNGEGGPKMAEGKDKNFKYATAQQNF